MALSGTLPQGTGFPPWQPYGCVKVVDIHADGPAVDAAPCDGIVVYGHKHYFLFTQVDEDRLRGVSRYAYVPLGWWMRSRLCKADDRMFRILRERYLLRPGVTWATVEGRGWQQRIVAWGTGAAAVGQEDAA